MADRLRELGRLHDWVAGGISATHHSAGRIDARGNQVRRAICWNDQTLAQYHGEGLKRLGGQEKVTPRHAPEIGEHSEEVLRAAGYAEADIRALRDQGIIA